MTLFVDPPAVYGKSILANVPMRIDVRVKTTFDKKCLARGINQPSAFSGERNEWEIVRRTLTTQIFRVSHQDRYLGIVCILSGVFLRAKARGSSIHSRILQHPCGVGVTAV